MSALRRARESMGLTRKQMAERFGLLYSYYVNIETGYRKPSARIAAEIALDVGMGIEQLFPGMALSTIPLSDRMVGEDPYIQLEQCDLSIRITQVLRTIPSIERQIIELRFGLNEIPRHTLKEAGCKLGLTPGRIHQIEATSMRRLRHPSRTKYLREYI